MRINEKRKSFRELRCLAIAGSLILATGCFDFMGYNEATRPQRVEREKARLPYYGTGVVSQVYRTSSGEPEDVRLTFRWPPRPALYTQLLLIRNNKLAGRVEVRTWAADDLMAGVLEGTPQVGDLAIGVIHEKEFGKQEPPSGRREMP